MTPEEKLAKQIDEHSLMFEKWKKTSEKISLEEFKEAIKEFRNQTKDSTELLGKNVPTGADKTTFNLIASRNAFTSVLLWGCILGALHQKIGKRIKKGKI